MDWEQEWENIHILIGHIELKAPGLKNFHTILGSLKVLVAESAYFWDMLPNFEQKLMCFTVSVTQMINWKQDVNVFHTLPTIDSNPKIVVQFSL